MMGIALHEFMQRYFASEKQTALLNMSLGLAMIVAATVLRRWSVAGSFRRGVAYPMIVAGLLLSSLACAYFFTMNQRSTSIARGYTDLPVAEATSRETARLERVVNHSYTGAFWICGVLIASGVAIGSVRGLSSIRGGIAFGLELAAVLVTASEVYSKQKNTRFLTELQSGVRRP